MDLNQLKQRVSNTTTRWLSQLKLIPILRTLNQESVVIDCGANVGDMTQQFAATGATVHAFEPDLLAFTRLQKRFGNSPNVFLYPQGVWNKNGELPLFMHKDQTDDKIEYTVSSSLIPNKINVDPNRSKIIQVIDLTDFMFKLRKKIQVVKLDIEGAEIAVLKKILETEAYNLFDLMLVETHEAKIPGLDQELIALKKIMRDKKVTHIRMDWL
jgi:FkbM family methyltransferase